MRITHQPPEGAPSSAAEGAEDTGAEWRGLGSTVLFCLAAVAGLVFLLLFGLCWRLEKRSCAYVGINEEERSSSNTAQEKEEETGLSNMRKRKVKKIPVMIVI